MEILWRYELFLGQKFFGSLLKCIINKDVKTVEFDIYFRPIFVFNELEYVENCNLTNEYTKLSNKHN